MDWGLDQQEQQYVTRLKKNRYIATTRLQKNVKVDFLSYYSYQGTFLLTFSTAYGG